MAASLNGNSGDSAGPSWDDSGLSDQYTDLPTLALRRATGAANALLDLVRAQPVVAAAIIAALLGAVVGTSLVRRPRRRSADLLESIGERVESASKGARDVIPRARRSSRIVDYRELVELAMRLAENPLVRGYVLRMLAKRLARRFQ